MKLLEENIREKLYEGQALVVHTCNPNYLGGRD
jgi:hypothetical protein